MRLVLTIVRHGKAAEYTAEAEDHGRRLVAKGEAQAKATGAQLNTLGWTAALALVSDAARARGTWEALVHGGFRCARTELNHAIFTTDQLGLSELLAEVSSAEASVVMVGHNPHLSMLATQLSGSYVNFATGEAVVLSIDRASWREAVGAAGAWQLEAFVRPGV